MADALKREVIMNIPERLSKLEKKVEDNVIKIILDDIKNLFDRTETYSRLTNGNKKDIDNMYENFRLMRDDMKTELKVIRTSFKWIYILVVTGILIPIVLFLIR